MDFLPPGATFTCATIRPDGMFVCAGTDAKKIKEAKSKPNDNDDDDPPMAYLVGWDIRKFNEPLLHLGAIHSDCVNSVQFP